MSDDLKASIERIRALSPKLNKVTDAANETVQRVEKFLNEECSLGMSCFVNVPELDRTDGHASLGYERIGGKYRITIEFSEYAREPDEWGKPTGPIKKDDYDSPIVDKTRSVAWSDSSRNEKLKTLAHLPELLKNLASEAETAISSAESAIAAVAKVTGALASKAAISVESGLMFSAIAHADNGPFRTVGYLDLDTGSVLFLAETPVGSDQKYDEGRRREIEGNPARFIEIPKFEYSPLRTHRGDEDRHIDEFLRSLPVACSLK